MTNKCDCYEQCEVLYHWHLNSNGKNSKVTRTFTGICNGTKEREDVEVAKAFEEYLKENN